MLPVLGACAGAELVLVVVGVDQFPKSDFPAGWAGVTVVGMEPVVVVPVGVLLIPGKIDVATVVMLADPPNIDVLLEDTEGAGLVVVRDEDGPRLVLAVVLPKMGLKLWTEGLLSGVDVVEEVVGVTAKMGLKPEASRGLVLITDPELLAGGAAVTGLEIEDTFAVLIWFPSPNRPTPAAGGVLLEGLET